MGAAGAHPPNPLNAYATAGGVRHGRGRISCTCGRGTGPVLSGVRSGWPSVCSMPATCRARAVGSLGSSGCLARRRTTHHGRDPQPGLALLRLAQGQGDAAVRGIGRALAEVEDQVSRRQLLVAYVEVMLTVGDVPAARAACSELAQIARSLDSAMLAAVSDRATGAVELADGNPAAALAPLRRASSGFRSIEAAYEVARTGILIARARRALGDEEGAALEFEASRATLVALGAVADLAMLDRLVHGAEATRDRLLTAREGQVLRLVARGSTNRSIAAELGLSERTIDRHVSNIFAKLGVSSRAAATASAYELNLF
jgi:DNA-binding NarL/FixJ family response regulator